MAGRPEARPAANGGPARRGSGGTISNDLIIAAIGDLPESVDLRYLVDKDFVLSLAGAPDQIGVLERCFNAVFLENQQPREASPCSCRRLLRIVLVIMLRLSRRQRADAARRG